MASRRTCPVCNQKWPEGKDPLEAYPDIYKLRVGDLTKGLSVHSMSMEADLFDCSPDETLAIFFCERLMEMKFAEEVLENALDKLRVAGLNLSLTKLAAGIPGYIVANGKLAADGMDNRWTLEVGEYRMVLEDNHLRVEEREDEQ